MALIEHALAERQKAHKAWLQLYFQEFIYHASLVIHRNNLESCSREFSYDASLGNLLNDFERVEDVLNRKNIVAEIIRRQPVVLVDSEQDVLMVADLRINAPDWEVSLFIPGELPQDVRDHIEETANFVGINVTPIHPFLRTLRY